MPKLTIDGRPVEVPEGATLLDAAHALEIDVPTLCYLGGCEPSTSCLVCMVKIRGPNRLVPSCATKALEGMEIESETPEVHQVRRTALELLLSDHLGDCMGPCQAACPAQMNVPRMLRQIQEGQLHEALVTVKEDIALPAVLGWICPKPCEKGCRRSGADGAVAVCQLKRFVAETDLGTENPYLPPCPPQSGKRVAVVGAGAAGLSAAYYLRREGHAVTLLDSQPEPGGRLRSETTAEQLPREVLDGEIAQVLRLGADWRPNTTVGRDLSLDDLLAEHDAVLLTCGNTARQQAEAFGVKTAAQGLLVEKETFLTSRPGVFAAGNALRAKGLAVRSVADGKESARAIGRWLAGRQPGGGKPFSVRMGRLDSGHLSAMVAEAGPAGRHEPGAQGEEYTVEEAIAQSLRCLHCDCRGLSSCKLRRYAAQYGADPNRYRGDKAAYRLEMQPSEVIYEPGKCIDCGLCIEIARLAGEPWGLSFIGRGFDVRVGVPFHRTLEEALSKVAARVIAACPTAALSHRAERASELPILGQR